MPPLTVNAAFTLPNVIVTPLYGALSPQALATRRWQQVLLLAGTPLGPLCGIVAETGIGAIGLVGAALMTFLLVRVSGAKLLAIRLLPRGALQAGQFFSGAGVTGGTGAGGVYYDTTTGSVYYDADGSGGLASTKFATLSGLPVLTSNDFFVG